jgi:hypothetical protein
MKEKTPSISAVKVGLLFLACLGNLPALGQSVRTRNPLLQLDQLSRSVQALAARVSPSVVQMLVARYGP